MQQWAHEHGRIGAIELPYMALAGSSWLDGILEYPIKIYTRGIKNPLGCELRIPNPQGLGNMLQDVVNIKILYLIYGAVPQ